MGVRPAPPRGTSPTPPYTRAVRDAVTVERPDTTPRLLRLADGRDLAFSEYGDPSGYPVIYCHGFPSSRREASVIHRAAQHTQVRIIAPDRPGFGASDYKANRKITDWPADVADLADHLQLGSFALLGVSGGAPFALATAASIPERLSGCTLVCPLGPVYKPEVLSQMRLPVRLNFEAAIHTPWFLRPLYGGLTSSLLFHWPQFVEGLVRDVVSTPADRQALADPEVSAIFSETVRDAMKNHARGAQQDLDLFVRPWGFDCGEIKAPITVWHGEQDAMVPVAHGHWYARELPHCQGRFLPEEGHYSLPLFHAEEILQSLFSAR